MTHGPHPGLDVALVAQNVVRRDGQGRVMVELARALLARGHRVTVYAHGLDEKLAGRVGFREIRRAPRPQLLDDLWMLWQATRAMGRSSHDVACVLGPSALPRCPTVFDVQFSHRGWRATWTRATRPGLYRRFHARVAEALETMTARRADRIVASTPALAAEVTARAPGARVSVVPNGVDLGEFAPVGARERAGARAGLGLRDAAFVVGFLGDYATTRKGLEPLVRAVAAGGRDEHLVVAARGDDRRLGALVRALGVGDRVVIAGFAPPRDVLAAADVLAVPSLYEPFSLVAFEAAAAGVPVVLSARAGAAPLLGDGVVAIDRPEDPTAVRAALDRVRAEPGLRDRLVATARAAVEGFTWQAVAEQAADVVEDVAGSRRLESRRLEPRAPAGDVPAGDVPAADLGVDGRGA